MVSERGSHVFVFQSWLSPLAPTFFMHFRGIDNTKAGFRGCYQRNACTLQQSTKGLKRVQNRNRKGSLATRASTRVEGVKGRTPALPILPIFGNAGFEQLQAARNRFRSRSVRSRSGYTCQFGNAASRFLEALDLLDLVPLISEIRFVVFRTFHVRSHPFAPEIPSPHRRYSTASRKTR